MSKITPNMEDYLEKIYLLEKRQSHVRVRDIAKEMSITMASVSGALKNLVKRGYVSHSRYDLVVLTPEGKQVAKDVFHRHQVIKTFLSKVLGLDSEIAERDACKIEHSVSPETIKSLARYLDMGSIKI